MRQLFFILTWDYFSLSLRFLIQCLLIVAFVPVLYAVTQSSLPGASMGIRRYPATAAPTPAASLWMPSFRVFGFARTPSSPPAGPAHRGGDSRCATGARPPRPHPRLQRPGPAAPAAPGWWAGHRAHKARRRDWGMVPGTSTLL